MQSKFINKEFMYDGKQLVSLYNYLQHQILGDSIIAWIGPCNIPFEHMADGEDLLAKAEIRGSRMVHFIIEKFDCTLLAAVALQRLLTAIVKDELGGSLRREGDDLFKDDRKLSISIATQTPVSSLIHFAVNVSNEGTPVKTLSLQDLGVEPKPFAEAILKKFSAEVESVTEATRKVRWAR